MSWIVLVLLMGMLISYPVYFYLLGEFRNRLARDHPALWGGRTSGHLSPSLTIAYKALREVRDGRLDGQPLSRPVLNSHRVATIFLYAGMVFFLGFLFLCLYDSVWGTGTDGE